MKEQWHYCCIKVKKKTTEENHIKQPLTVSQTQSLNKPAKLALQLYIFSIRGNTHRMYDGRLNAAVALWS